MWQWHPVIRTFRDFVSYLDRTGVQRGIINSVRSQLAKNAAGFIAGNREVAKHVEEHKGCFLGACGVNPLSIDEALPESGGVQEAVVLSGNLTRPLRRVSA